MDFALEGTAVAVRDVAEDVFARRQPDWESTFGKLGSGEAGTGDQVGGFDAETWRALVDAGLLALPLPAYRDGDEVDEAGLLPLFRRMGRAAAVTPALGTLTAALVFAKAGSPEDVADAWSRWGESLTGGLWAAIAIGEHGDPLTPTPQTSVRGGRLNGTKVGVLHAEGASVLLVTSDAGIVAVSPTSDGVTLTRTPASSGWGEYTVTFDDVPVDDADVISRELSVLRDRYRLALCAYADGLVAGATRLTADHVSTREQFGKPIALFQAVGQQLADVYVIGRSMELSTTAAAWRLSEGLDAATDLGIAAYWLAEEIPPTLRTMTHLHGGIGVDITYPLHRYFSIAKDLARLVGGAAVRLDELADITEGAAPADRAQG
ncbi:MULTISPECIES: acyl-CoA dehydrogenase family protein [Gordonia]|uniref:acyl-CoA dehydrogenase family protein n=1 Tax=Gordonia TaxID=2053 RepID=UPI000413F0FD|nr:MULTISPECIES: acyl-CoA dehydrogenase family protein [Gordonia]KAF0970940.1 Acyl-CoA dehydrogenase FadE28 [Gordonia sp. YY1]MCZ4580111.1 acyl-CoA/acyl-ACP dehydrogenase [Gordonia amicalis]